MTHHSSNSVEPRLSAEFEISQRLTLKNAIGLAAQPPSFVVPIAGFEIGGLPGGLQRGVQSSAGFEYRLPDDMSLGVSVFHNAFFNMSDPLGSAEQSGRAVIQGQAPPTSGCFVHSPLNPVGSAPGGCVTQR